ncbi:MAG: hypothetical protein JWM89_1522 [Acidimicrobiales bacterium]|nr:hypothetical protein [Acidimicrobiales bacterium]
MDDLRGLLLVGTFAGVEPVRSRDGVAVPGLFKVLVDTGRDGQFLRDATFNRIDRDTETTTAFAAQLDELAPKDGDPVAVTVGGRISKPNAKGDRYINYDAKAIRSLAPAIPAGK